MAFLIHEPDHTLNPHTGMSRAHWLQAAKYLMDGVFQHITGMLKAD